MQAASLGGEGAVRRGEGRDAAQAAQSAGERALAAEAEAARLRERLRNIGIEPDEN
jgi:hypothetical protein